MRRNFISSSTLTQILFGSLLDSPAIVELTARLLEKAVPIIKSHFTFSADEITKAYKENSRYSFVAILLIYSFSDKDFGLKT